MMGEDAIRHLVRQACTAPSSHNTQPWRFRLRESAVDVLADRTRALPVNDPCDRELVISCGAAVFSLRVAAAAAGLGGRLHLLPDAGDPDLLAHVELVPGEGDTGLAALAPALERRRTCREAFRGQPVAPADRNAVQCAVAAEGAGLVALEGDDRTRAGALVAEGDRRQWADPRWRGELARWMRPRGRGDGLAVPSLAAPVARAVIRTFDLGNGVAAPDRQLAAGSPWLTVLATQEDDTAAWLQAGQALQRALLTGVGLGLQASHLNQPIQVAALRPGLGTLLGTGAHPQLLLRWGHPAKELPATPRRPVDAVLEM